MAIADGGVLNDALSEADGDLDAVPRLFNNLRYNDVQRTLDIEEVMLILLFDKLLLISMELHGDLNQASRSFSNQWSVFCI